MPVNNVTRFLDSKGISYTAFELPLQKLGAEDTAMELNAPLSIIFKSIVILRKEPGKPILAVVPGNTEVDLKALAKTVSEKKVQPATQKEAEKLTKLKVGGISPLALINRGFEIIFDSSIRDHEHIHVSGGEIGINIRLSSSDLIKITGAKVVSISRVSMT
jgi:Cys-tRNA(Pro)/Cys-tRNA(Cys) deacylase